MCNSNLMGSVDMCLLVKIDEFNNRVCDCCCMVNVKVISHIALSGVITLAFNWANMCCAKYRKLSHVKN